MREFLDGLPETFYFAAVLGFLRLPKMRSQMAADAAVAAAAATAQQQQHNSTAAQAAAQLERLQQAAEPADLTIYFLAFYTFV